MKTLYKIRRVSDGLFYIKKEWNENGKLYTMEELVCILIRLARGIDPMQIEQWADQIEIVPYEIEEAPETISVRGLDQFWKLFDRNSIRTANATGRFLFAILMCGKYTDKETNVTHKITIDPDGWVDAKELMQITKMTPNRLIHCVDVYRGQQSQNLNYPPVFELNTTTSGQFIRIRRKAKIETPL
jgi:hypothetical protein